MPISPEFQSLKPLEVINRKFTEHITQTGKENFQEHIYFIPKDKVISLLELVLNNSVFSIQGKFYQQLQGVAKGSTVPPVIPNIYMKYFEEMVLGPQINQSTNLPIYISTYIHTFTSMWTEKWNTV